jgi:trimeric autotransporter adhesin
MKPHHSQRNSLLLLTALTLSADSAFAERADQVTAAVAAPSAAEQSASKAKVAAKVNLQPLADVLPGRPNISKMVEDTRAKANARAVSVSAQRRQELAAGLAHEETSALTPTTDTISLKLANGQVVKMRNLGTTDATVIGVNKIWPGGANAASLNGGGITAPPSGTTIGQFEQFIPYLPHVEFGSPSRVTDPLGANSPDSHATSVAGVMVAAGTSAGAKGIAYQGSINAYTWIDPFGTVLGQAASDSRVSNHSYGGVFGWDTSILTIPVSGGPSISRQVNYFIGDIFANRSESPDFGLYNSEARIADETAYLQPYQQLVAAAGNDRGQNEFAGNKSIFVGGNPYFIAQAGLITLGIQEDVLFNGTNYWHFSQGSLSVVNANTPSEQIVFTPSGGETASPLSGKPGADGGTLGFDTIPKGLQTSKNALTVGSVTSANALWFQAQSPTVVGQGTVFGPTDDGRIKPDVMANGVNVNTPKLTIVAGVPQNNQYETAATGTSFSAAAVSGGTALLSELQERSVNYSPKEPLRAATLKGLVIHTATDISTTGPDYRSGWGIAQIDKAAALIQANYNSAARTYVKEVVLPDNKAVAFTVRAAGSQAIKVTASWADPVAQPDPSTGLIPDQQAWTESIPGSGTFVEPTNSVLNNNIDVRIYPITDNTTNPPTLGTAILPWKLNPASPATAATRAQNDVDNVEQVVTPTSPPAGTLYRVIVSQKAGTTLIDVDGNGTADAQPLSVIVTGVSTQTENFAITGNSFSFSGGNVTATLTWNSLVGGYYIIESSTNLSTWTVASGIFNTITESTTAASNPLPASPSKFFRVRKVSPNPFNVP